MPETCTFVREDGSEVPAMRWQNADGTLGGWVAQGAKVHRLAVIKAGALVGPAAHVKAYDVVQSGELIDDGIRTKIRP